MIECGGSIQLVSATLIPQIILQKLVSSQTMLMINVSTSTADVAYTPIPRRRKYVFLFLHYFSIFFTKT